MFQCDWRVNQQFVRLPCLLLALIARSGQSNWNCSNIKLLYWDLISRNNSIGLITLYRHFYGFSEIEKYNKQSGRSESEKGICLVFVSFGDQISLIKKCIHIYRYQETVLNRYVIRYLTATRRNKININAGLAGFLSPSFHHHRDLQMFFWLCADSTQIPYASDKIQLFHSIPPPPAQCFTSGYNLLRD